MTAQDRPARPTGDDIRSIIGRVEGIGLVVLDPKSEELRARLETVLVAHQRQDRPPVFNSCLCGWSDLGLSFPGHQVDMLLAVLAS